MALLRATTCGGVRPFDMMRIALLFAFVPMILASGCGGASDNASVHGTIGGKGFASAHAISNSSSDAMSGSALIAVSTVANECAQISSDAAAKTDVQALLIGLFEADGAGNTVAPAHTGDFTILATQTSGQLASAFYEAVGPTLGDTAPVNASDGKVTLTSFTGGHYVGSFDLTFGADQVTGTFDSDPCSNLRL